MVTDFPLGQAAKVPCYQKFSLSKSFDLKYILKLSDKASAHFETEIRYFPKSGTFRFSSGRNFSF